MRLWLDFKDENGQDRRVEAAGELFTIGRHSANDLAVADSRLCASMSVSRTLTAIFTFPTPARVTARP